MFFLYNHIERAENGDTAVIENMEDKKIKTKVLGSVRLNC